MSLIDDCMLIPGFLFREDLESILDIMQKHCPESNLPIAEVGVYCGRSTLLLSQFGHVIGIDGYLADGEPENPGKSRFEIFSDYSKRFKFDAELWPTMSLQGASKALNDGIKFKCIFIDASHDYKSIKEDLIAWKPLLMEGGLIFGDDCTIDFPGVEQAIKEEFGTYKTSANGKIWFR